MHPLHSMTDTSFYPLSKISSNLIGCSLIRLEMEYNTFEINRNTLFWSLTEWKQDLVTLGQEVDQLTEKNPRKWCVGQKRHKGSPCLAGFFLQLVSKIFQTDPERWKSVGACLEVILSLFSQKKWFFINGLSPSTLTQLKLRSLCLEKTLHEAGASTSQELSALLPWENTLRFSKAPSLLFSQEEMPSSCKKVQAAYEKLLDLEMRWLTYNAQIKVLAEKISRIKNRFRILSSRIKRKSTFYSLEGKGIKDYFLYLASFACLDEPLAEDFNVNCEKIERDATETTKKFLGGNYEAVLWSKRACKPTGVTFLS